MISGQKKTDSLRSLNPQQKMRLKEMLLEDISLLHMALEREDNERARGKIEYIRNLIQFLE